MEMRTLKYSKREIVLVYDLVSHSTISYQASELHQKRGRATLRLKRGYAVRSITVIGLDIPQVTRLDIPIDIC
jgi:hypothetical protein